MTDGPSGLGGVGGIGRSRRVGVEFERFRFAFMGQGTVYLWQICVSMVVSIVVVFFGLALFKKMERTCVDMI